MATSLGDWQGREAHSSQGLIASELVAKSQEEEGKREVGEEKRGSRKTDVRRGQVGYQTGPMNGNNHSKLFDGATSPLSPATTPSPYLSLTPSACRGC